MFSYVGACNSKQDPTFPENNPNWPRWGHDNHNTFANLRERKLCLNNASTLSTKWLFDLEQYGAYDGEYTEGAVIVVDDISYILSILAIIHMIGSDGLPVSTFGATVSPFSPGMRYVQDPNLGYRLALSTPAIYGNYIYTATQAVDESFTGIGLYLNSIDRFTGLDNPNWPAQGAIVPVYPTEGHTLDEAYATSEITTSVTIVDGLVFIAVTNSGFDAFQRGAVSAYRLSNGTLVWSEIIEPDAGGGTGSWSTPAFDTDLKLMYFGTTNQKDLPVSNESDAVQARYYKTGKLAWNYQYVPNDVAGNLYPYSLYNPIYTTDRDVGASPNVFDVKDLQLVGACGKDGVYRAMHRKCGNLAWQTILSTTPTLWGNPSAAYNNGVIYAATSTDIDQSLLGTTDIVPYQSYSQLILGTGQANASLKDYLYSQGILAALDAYSGKILWKKQFPSLFWAGVTYANGMLFTGSYDGTVRVINALDGTVIFSTTVPAQTQAPGVPISPYAAIPANLTVSNGVVYVPYFAVIGNQGGVLALSTSTFCSQGKARLTEAPLLVDDTGISEVISTLKKERYNLQ